MDSTIGPLLQDDAPNLNRGDRIFGFVRSDDASNQIMLTGGARLEVTGASSDHFAFVEIEQFRQNAFGANTGQARALRPDSIVEKSDIIEAGLRYRVNGSWQAPTRGPVEHDLLASIVKTSDRNQTIDLCYPGYDPRAAMLVAIELLLNGNLQSDVGLFVPGTRYQWGQKSDLRNEYGRYGICRRSERDSDPKLLKEVVPTAYISDGKVKTSGNSETGQRLIISKNVDEFEEIPTPEYLITSHISRLQEGTQEVIENLAQDRSNNSVVRLWSPFTKLEREGAPTYGPPYPSDGERVTIATDTSQQVEELGTQHGGLSTPEKRAEPVNSNEENEGLQYPPTAADLVGYLHRNSIRFEVLNSSTISDALGDLFSEYKTFKDVGYHRAAHLTFNTQMFFERLPTTVGYHDRWVRDRAFDGEVFLPKTSEEYIEDLASHEVDGEGGSLLHVRKTAEQVSDILREESPMFERLISLITEQRDCGETVAIYNSSKKGGTILREALADRAEITESDLGEEVRIVDRDSIRHLEPVDLLLFCGMQQPGQSAYYVHPRADETVLLAYSDWVVKSVQRHAEDAFENLRGFFGQTGSTLSGPIFETPDTRDDIDTPPEGDSPTGGSEPNEDSDATVRNEPHQEDINRTAELIPDDLSERDLRRLEDIVNLAPSKNAELADQWGFEGGSELYQYLSSNLQEYYKRNQDHYIVPTEKGKRILSDIN